ncbi:uncharacterized protein BXZ73DRAFT_74805 [Epithele typhae]|uniref:uncharacterized protein n=1 Tax=Epithele typhae TaxID=378194 RepID=UPI002008524E|nr:uncharacterized protein BXZ73DRAFT_74805 [Epithele typhae]KAH9941584.1 hypothetical protein BXZ73DRAFT_74805 [Epithele typhae]
MFRFSVALALLPAFAMGHAVVTQPVLRQPGAASLAACGSAVEAKLKSDPTGPLTGVVPPRQIENSVKAIDSTTTTDCALYQCRGYKAGPSAPLAPPLFEDNADNVATYSPGDVVNFHVDLVAHHTGFANISVIDLAADAPLARLFTWPVYANSNLGPADWPANETNFNVTIPDLGGVCAEAGACAIQWWWYATENGQTYESCVDFVGA